MKEYNNLLRTLGAFMEDLWLPYEDSIGCVNTEIENGVIDKEKLLCEFKNSVNDPNFNWIQLAQETQLLISPNDYSNIEICNYVKWLLQDYLYPEKVLTENEIQQLGKDVEDVLKKHFINEGWMFSYELYKILKSKCIDFEYYNLHKINYQSFSIEGRFLAKKDREIGYLRYNEKKINNRKEPLQNIKYSVDEDDKIKPKVNLKHNSEIENQFTLHIKNAPKNAFTVDSIENEEHSMFSKGNWVFVLFAGYSGQDIKMVQSLLEVVEKYPHLNFAFKPYMNDERIQQFTKVLVTRKVTPILLSRRNNVTTFLSSSILKKEEIEEILGKI